MVHVPYKKSEYSATPRWYIREGEYIYVCHCGHAIVVPFDRVKTTGEVTAGISCNACATHCFITLEGIGGSRA